MFDEEPEELAPLDASEPEEPMFDEEPEELPWLSCGVLFIRSFEVPSAPAPEEGVEESIPEDELDVPMPEAAPDEVSPLEPEELPCLPCGVICKPSCILEETPGLLNGSVVIRLLYIAASFIPRPEAELLPIPPPLESIVPHAASVIAHAKGNSHFIIHLRILAVKKFVPDTRKTFTSVAPCRSIYAFKVPIFATPERRQNKMPVDSKCSITFSFIG